MGKGARWTGNIIFRNVTSPPSNWILPWTLKRCSQCGLSLQVWGLLSRVGEVPEVGRHTASLRLRWDLSHPWKLGPWGQEQQGCWGQSETEVPISLTHEFPLMNSITSPTWPSSSCDSSQSIQSFQLKIKNFPLIYTAEGLALHNLWECWIKAGPVRTVSHLIPEASGKQRGATCKAIYKWISVWSNRREKTKDINLPFSLF